MKSTALQKPVIITAKTHTKKHIKHTIMRRAEKVDMTQTLFSHPVRGQVWREWATKHIPEALYKEFGLLAAPGSEEWQNVVEHNVFVAAASLTLAQQIQRSGRRVKTDRVVRAAIVHDVTKRRDVEQDKSREVESYDSTLEQAMTQYGYSYDDIIVAMNTGRADDRYITDAAIRYQAITSKPLEATIVGYIDARTRGAHVFSLVESQQRNLAAKLRPQDKEFFTSCWMSYYQAVETYLHEIDVDFNPTKLTDDAVYQTVLKITKDYHRQ